MKKTAAHSISRWSCSEERRAVNTALDRGANWKEIQNIIASYRPLKINPQNLSNYRKSPDRKRWLAEQERLEAIRTQSDLTAAIVRHYTTEGGSPAEAGMLAAAEILTKALADLPPEQIKDLLKTDPKKFFNAVTALAQLTAWLGKQKQLNQPSLGEKPAGSAQSLREIFGLP